MTLIPKFIRIWGSGTNQTSTGNETRKSEIDQVGNTRVFRGVPNSTM